MLEEIKNVLQEELFVEEEITPTSILKDDLHLDSVAAVELSLQLEEKYDINITEQELVKLVTIQDVMNLLETKGVGNNEDSKN